MYDYILRGGIVVDGTGSPAIEADVAIKDGKIAKIQRDIKEPAKEILDVTGLAVSPGFIDFHSHSDTGFLVDDRCESKIYQGITTELAGQCGSTIYPCPEDRLESLREYAGESFKEFASSSFQEFLDKVTAHNKKMATNLVSLIGHGAIRVGVMGFEDRKATREELAQMQALLDRDMKAGAWGLSLGLGYSPGVSSDQEELNALGEVVAKYDGIITSHMRRQDEKTPESLEEMYEINRQTGAHVHIAHFKAAGRQNWGRAPEFVNNVADARTSGIHVTVDVYPYTAASSGITNSFPRWSIQGGVHKAIERLKSESEERRKLMADLEEIFKTQADGESLYVVTTNGRYPIAGGKTIWELSQELGLSMAVTVAKVAVETEGRCTCISFAMSEEDVDYMLAQKDYVIGSDGRGLPLAPEENKGKPHPRNFGTFPRFLRWAREKGIPLQESVHRITGLSAMYLGLPDRGLLKAGFVADITVFDPVKVTDKATYDNPFQKPVGIEHVFIGGKPALFNGEQTDLRLGQFILKKQEG
jgi:N-acyl-D-amino-acid deacylase